MRNNESRVSCNKIIYTYFNNDARARRSSTGLTYWDLDGESITCLGVLANHYARVQIIKVFILEAPEGVS